jgi:ABC-type transport system involved in multi-copper enzyme maturation permease subunit
LNAQTRPPRAGFPNPVLWRELRARFRGPRAFSLITAYLVFILGLAFAVYRQGLDEGAPAAQIGQALFGALLLAQLIGILLVAPGLTMAALSGEVERRTYELLLATPLSGAAIVRGKLGAAVAFLIVFLASGLPFLGLAWSLGGVGLGDLLRSQFSLLLAATLLASLGLGASALLLRTERAAIAAYLATAGFCLLPPLLIWMLASLRLADANLRALISGALAAISPLAPVIAAGRQGILGFVYGAAAPAPVAIPGLASFLAQAWGIQAGLCLGLLLFCADRVRPLGPRLRQAAVILGLLLLGWLAWLLSAPPAVDLIFGAFVGPGGA